MDFLNAIWLFVCDHYHVFIDLALAIFVLLVTLLSKKVKVIDTIKGFITQCLPTAINEAEKRFGSGQGQEKLSFVIDLLVSYISDKYDLPEATVIRLYHSFIHKSVESILTTPQKKER